MSNRPTKNGGFVLLLIVLSMLGILGAFFVMGLASRGNKISRDGATAVALAKAKDALIAYALTHDTYVRPGEFPCPTTVSPTGSTYGTSTGTLPGGSCATVRIGRLPWKTLGIQELFDSDGEPLWYAVSTKFRQAAATKINSDALGDLTVHAAGGSAVLSSQVVAVVFSAGAPVSGQNRTSAASLCATTSTTIAGNTCATNYLDISSGRNNATNAGPYIADRPSSTFNDQLIVITTADFIPKIEDRIVAILTRTLNAYYATNGYYPYATTYSDITFPNRMNCANNTYYGRLPVYMAVSPYTQVVPCTGVAEWPGITNPNSLPAWFSQQEWNTVVHYVVGKAYVIGGTKVCGAIGDCLTVDADNTVQAMFILPGTPTLSQSRPSSFPADYLEASANLDEWPVPANYTYETTTSPLPSRDRVIAIKNP